MCSLSLSLWIIVTRWMKLSGSGSDTLAGKAHSFSMGCGLSDTVTIVCGSPNKLAASTRAWCF